MKKVLSFVLALVMVLALSVTAFAYDSVSQSENQTVTADYEAGKDTVPTVYNFTVTWAPDANNNLAYNGKQATYKWDTTGLVYSEEVTKAAGWTGEAKYTVTVANSSNAVLSIVTKATSDYKLSATTSDGKTDVTVARADEGIDYTTTNQGGVKSASVVYTFKGVTGTSTAITGDKDAKGVTVGNINITVDKVTPAAP